MDKAKIVAEGSPRQLIERYVTREVLELRFNREDDDADGASARDGRASAGDLAGADAAAVAERAELERQLEGLADRIEHLPDRLLVYTADGDATAAAAFERGLRPASILVRRASLEDVFLRLTGRSLVE
jgi:lipooligosaccharide transport system ATP-binding protein